MRSVTLSVAVGYYSVFLCVLPQLLTALLLGICKCIADKEFRRWTFGDKVLYALIGSLVPMAIERSNTEDISRNAQEHLPRTEVTETLKSETEEHPEEVPMKVDAMIEEAEEVKMGDMVGEQTEGPNEFILTQRNTTKELCALFILHAASVILGAAFIAFLDETSSEFAVSRIKVRVASGIDLMDAVFMGCPIILLASIVFRAIHSKLDPWPSIGKKISTCKALCPPALTSSQEQIKFTLSDDEDEDSKQEQNML